MAPDSHKAQAGAPAAPAAALLSPRNLLVQSVEALQERHDVIVTMLDHITVELAATTAALAAYDATAGTTPAPRRVLTAAEGRAGVLRLHASGHSAATIADLLDADLDLVSATLADAFRTMELLICPACHGDRCTECLDSGAVLSHSPSPLVTLLLGLTTTDPDLPSAALEAAARGVFPDVTRSDLRTAMSTIRTMEAA